jgi:Holliday junction resolvase
VTNKNYVKGRRKEYLIVKRLKEQGFEIAQRTAGSHSPFDVIGIDINKKIIKLIQSKPDSMNAHQQQKIRNENKNLNGLFYVKFSVV